MNEKERADHSDSRYKLLQSQNSQIEKVTPHKSFYIEASELDLVLDNKLISK